MPQKTPLALFALAALLGGTTPLAAQVQRSTLHDFEVVTVAEGLVNPWSMAWLPNGDMLITERPGRLRIVRDGVLLPEAVSGVPEVLARGQGGLFDVLPHPDFANNNLIYLSYSRPKDDGEGASTGVVRGVFQNDEFTNIEQIWVAQSTGNGHYGGRMAFDGEGHLFITAGDRQVPSTGDLEKHPAQDPSNHHGVIVRINDDGTIPADNPMIGTPGALGDIYSYGHRNPQGFVINHETGDLWSTEHGPQGGDELNLIEPGNNYGWPVIGYGVNYGSGSTIHEGTRREGMTNSEQVWVPSIALSGLMIYTGDKFPAWRGNLFAGGMAGEQLARLTLDGQSVASEETLLQGIGRVRDVRTGPDGYIYVAIEDRAVRPTNVVRLVPAGRR
ncbi:MAG: PQQ-dependent sugar dehydrogenase [Gemmatimonadetes bacterium]|nr:PQQ-dependent sugar dehydrogenase [Gemmatimonadota bacterium]